MSPLRVPAADSLVAVTSVAACSLVACGLACKYIAKPCRVHDVGREGHHFVYACCCQTQGGVRACCVAPLIATCRGGLRLEAAFLDQMWPHLIKQLRGTRTLVRGHVVQLGGAVPLSHPCGTNSSRCSRCADRHPSCDRGLCRAAALASWARGRPRGVGCRVLQPAATSPAPALLWARPEVPDAHAAAGDLLCGASSVDVHDAPSSHQLPAPYSDVLGAQRRRLAPLLRDTRRELRSRSQHEHADRATPQPVSSER